jgi:pyruvate formate lyase activating enzyme
MLVQCQLCPKGCVIKPGQSGECRVRVNIDGRLVAVTYGHPCSAHVDPIEKKPLFHFMPGTAIFSIATAGCNLHCKNCQNWEISQANPEDVDAYDLPPEKIAAAAQERNCRAVAYTYTEPLVYYEYTLDSCVKVREAGMKNVIVSAGYLNKEPLRKLYAVLDAAKIDIKSMSDAFYRDVCDATLAPVLDACVLAREAGVPVEPTNLVIPTLNDSDDDFRKLARWIVENMGKDTPLHFSRFFPQYQMKNLPPTPEETLDRAKEIAVAEGLYYVYIGNVSRPGAENTYCPSCKKAVIERRGYQVLSNTIADGKCSACGAEIKGVWK